MAVYQSIYEGGGYSLDPKYNISVSSDYQSPASSFALVLDARTSNQLKETADKLNTGAKTLEVSGAFTKQFEAIPEQHLDEIRRQAKLVGSKLTLHGPMEEPSGFSSKQGGGNEWKEENRQHVERQFTQAMERAHKLDPKGNIIVTLHSTAELPEMLQREKIDGKEKLKGMWVVNSRTGQVAGLKEQARYFPQEKGQEKYIFNPENEIRKINRDNWNNEIHEAVYSLDLAEQRENRLNQTGLAPKTSEILNGVESGKISMDSLPEGVKEQVIALKEVRRSEEAFLRQSYSKIKNLYDEAYHSALEKNNLKDQKKLNEFRDFVNKNWDEVESRKPNLKVLREVIEKGVDTFNSVDDEPVLYQPLQKFIIDKSSDTFANVAYNSYKKFGKSAPIISIENPPAGQGISRAKDMKQLVEASQEKFVKKLVSQGYSKKESQAIADKLIGVTWDVGHINMIRKYGYDDKDLLKEAKTIKPFLKHIHLSDNFGFEHTELPMGMGNVPLKETAKVFGKKFNKVAKAIETADWYQHFQVTPFKMELDTFGSPVSEGGGETWNQVAWSYAPYYAGYGTVNPEIHHSIYGRGFSALPQELGGQMSGQQSSRVTGTPLA